VKAHQDQSRHQEKYNAQGLRLAEQKLKPERKRGGEGGTAEQAAKEPSKSRTTKKLKRDLGKRGENREEGKSEKEGGTWHGQSVCSENTQPCEEDVHGERTAGS